MHICVFIYVDWGECYSWLPCKVQYVRILYAYLCTPVSTCIRAVNREVEWVRPQHRTACTSCIFLACCEHNVALFLFPTSELGLQWGVQSQAGHRHKIYNCTDMRGRHQQTNLHISSYTCVHHMHRLIHTDTPHTVTPVNTQLLYVAIYTHT